MRNIKILLVIILSIIAYIPTSYSLNFPQTEVNILSQYPKVANPIYDIIKNKATVGVIPYYQNKNGIYILLGRERVDSNKGEAAGKFCDFGGNAVENTTIISNLIRELYEETIKILEPTENDIITQGKLLYKKSNSGREIYYVFYPLTEEEYKKTLDLNTIRAHVELASTKSCFAEKDQFIWLSLSDIRNNIDDLHINKNTVLEIKDIEGNLRSISLRKYFIEDCILHPAFQSLVNQLQ